MIFGGLEKFTLIDYPGKIACVAYTIGCNFRCPYCHNPSLVDETTEVRISEDEVLALLERKKGLVDGVVITGGEPTIHGKDLLRFMGRVKRRGFLVKLDSNGTHPEVLRAAISKKLVDYIAMDIKAPLADYPRIAARPVDTKAVRRSIVLLLYGNIPYEFRTTVVKSLLSPKDLEEIGKEIRGARRYYLQKFAPANALSPQFRKKVTYSNEEFAALQEMLHSYVQSCDVR